MPPPKTRRPAQAARCLCQDMLDFTQKPAATPPATPLPGSWPSFFPKNRRPASRRRRCRGGWPSFFPKNWRAAPRRHCCRGAGRRCWEVERRCREVECRCRGVECRCRGQHRDYLLRLARDCFTCFLFLVFCLQLSTNKKQATRNQKRPRPQGPEAQAEKRIGEVIWWLGHLRPAGGPPGFAKSAGGRGQRRPPHGPTAP